MGLDFFELIWKASLPVQFIMALLLAASVASWAAIVFKWREFKSASRENAAFLSALRGGRLLHADAAGHKTRGSPLAALYVAARASRNAGESAEQQINNAAMQELARFQKYLVFLSTVGSQSVYVALLGTVLGIVDVFVAMGMQQQLQLAVGIAEALIVTAIGLFTAVPAVSASNFFTARIDALQDETAAFAAELNAGAAAAPAAAAPEGA